MDFKSLDFRFLKKMMQPQAANDLNAFLERMPIMVGQQVLVAGGIAWAMAGALGLYTFVETGKMMELRKELRDTKALTPVVPKIKDIPVSSEEVAKFAKDMSDTYRGLAIKSQGSSLYITATDTSRFAEFREAIGHVQNGGQGWRVSIDRLCVGRECDKDKLAALLKINKVSVEKPSQ